MGRQQHDYQVHVPCSSNAAWFGPSELSEDAHDLIERTRRQANQIIGPSSRDRARLLHKLSELWAAWQR